MQAKGGQCVRGEKEEVGEEVDVKVEAAEEEEAGETEEDEEGDAKAGAAVFDKNR